MSVGPWFLASGRQFWSHVVLMLQNIIHWCTSEYLFENLQKGELENFDREGFPVSIDEED